MHDTFDTPVAASQLEEVFKSIVDHAGAKAVYGEPIVLEGKTVLPVARVRYGFGGGSGGKGNHEQYGGGGGGGLLAQPLGVIEITAFTNTVHPDRTPKNRRRRRGARFLSGTLDRSEAVLSAPLRRQSGSFGGCYLSSPTCCER